MKRQLPVIFLLIIVYHTVILVKHEFFAQRMLLYLLEDFSFHPLRCFAVLRYTTYTLASLLMLTLSSLYLIAQKSSFRNKVYKVLRYTIVIAALVGLPELIRQMFIAPFEQSWPYMLGGSFFLYASFVVYNVKPEKPVPAIDLSQYPLVTYTSLQHRFCHFLLDTLFFISASYYWDNQTTIADSLNGKAISELSWLLLQFFLFYFLSELLFRQTFAKIFTNSCVAGTNSIPNADIIFKRTMLRLVPPEAISFLFKINLHDRFSGTTVVENGSWKDIVFESEANDSLN